MSCTAYTVHKLAVPCPFPVWRSAFLYATFFHAAAFFLTLGMVRMRSFVWCDVVVLYVPHWPSGTFWKSFSAIRLFLLSSLLTDPGKSPPFTSVWKERICNLALPNQNQEVRSIFEERISLWDLNRAITSKMSGIYAKKAIFVGSCTWKSLILPKVA